jgi:ribosomal protein S16
MKWYLIKKSEDVLLIIKKYEKKMKLAIKLRKKGHKRNFNYSIIILKKKKNIHSEYKGKVGDYEYRIGEKNIYISEKKLLDWRRKGVILEGKVAECLINV